MPTINNGITSLLKCLSRAKLRRSFPTGRRYSGGGRAGTAIRQTAPDRRPGHRSSRGVCAAKVRIFTERGKALSLIITTLTFPRGRFEGISDRFSGAGKRSATAPRRSPRNAENCRLHRPFRVADRPAGRRNGRRGRADGPRRNGERRAKRRFNTSARPPGAATQRA